MKILSVNYAVFLLRTFVNFFFFKLGSMGRSFNSEQSGFLHAFENGNNLLFYLNDTYFHVFLSPRSSRAVFKSSLTPWWEMLAYHKGYFTDADRRGPGYESQSVSQVFSRNCVVYRYRPSSSVSFFHLSLIYCFFFDFITSYYKDKKKDKVWNKRNMKEKK